MQMNGIRRRRKQWPDSSRACPLSRELFARSLAATRLGSVHASTDTQHETLEAHRTGAENSGRRLREVKNDLRASADTRRSMSMAHVAQMCYIDLRSENPAKLTMSTTTIRMDDALKARIAAAAERAGKSSHAFILDALSETVERIETDNELHRIADERWVALKRTGESVAWADAKEYLRARASGKKARRPSARQPAR